MANKWRKRIETISTWLVGLVGVNVGINAVANLNLLEKILGFFGTYTPIATGIVEVGAGIGGVFLIINLTKK